MAIKTASRFTARDVGARLRTLRLAHRIKTQREIATYLGVDVNRYNNWENGVPIPVNFAIKLCIRYGATLDYIFRGNLGGLPHDLVTALSEAEEAASPPATPATGTSGAQ